MLLAEALKAEELEARQRRVLRSGLGLLKGLRLCTHQRRAQIDNHLVSASYAGYLKSHAVLGSGMAW